MIIKKYFPDGSFAYVNKFTDKVVKLRKETTRGMGRLPDYAFRYLKPAKV